MKLNGKYSSWSEINFIIPQGSILGQLLLNIFLCDLFLFFPNLYIANYANDNTPYSTNINSNKPLHDLEKYSNTLSKWFIENLLKANPEKTSSYKFNTRNQITIGGMTISNSKCEKLLGIHINNKLSF